MKALVLWSDDTSHNLGVRALGQGSAAVVERAFPGAEVAFRNYGRGDGPAGIGHRRMMARQLTTGKGALIEWLRTFDLVMDTRAGDSFADIYGLPRLTVMTATAELVRRAGVPLVLGPQTIGPFATRRGRLLARRSMSTARLVMSRDAESASAAASLRHPVDVRTTDVVFGLPGVFADGDRDVIVNPSGLLWNDNGHVDAAAYRDVVTQLCRRLVAAGRRVTLLAHVLDSPLQDNDVRVLGEVAERVEGVHEIVVPTSLEHVRAVLASAQVVIGSRMHACLNALSVGRPAIPLAYSRKFAPLLADLGWHHTVDLRQGNDQVHDVLAALDDPGLEDSVSDLRERASDRLALATDALVAL